MKDSVRPTVKGKTQVQRKQSLRSCLPHAAANESILSSHYAQIINTQRQSFLLNIHPQSGKRERIAPEG